MEDPALPTPAQRVLHAFDSIWFVTLDDGWYSLHRDGAGGRQRDRTLRFDAAPARFIDGIAAEGGSVWLLERSFEYSRLVRIDPDSMKVIDRIALRETPLGGSSVDLNAFRDDLTSGDGSLWCLTLDGSLAQIGPSGGREIRRFEVGGRGALSVGTDAVWLARRSDGALLKITPHSAKVQTVDVGDDALAVAVHAGLVWVTRGREDEPADAGPTPASLIALDAQTHRPVSRPVPLGRAPMALDVDKRDVWVANRQDGTVMRVTY